MASIENDNTEDFATLLAEYDQKRGVNPKKREPREGDVVKGKIVSIGREAVFVDIGAKSDGMIDLIELRGEDGAVAVQIGDSGRNGRTMMSGSAGITPEMSV